MKKLIMYAIVTAVVVALVWGLTVLGKTITYKIFYEGQVRATITEVLDERQGQE